MIGDGSKEPFQDLGNLASGLQRCQKYLEQSLEGIGEVLASWTTDLSATR